LFLSPSPTNKHLTTLHSSSFSVLICFSTSKNNEVVYDTKYEYKRTNQTRMWEQLPNNEAKRQEKELLTLSFLVVKAGKKAHFWHCFPVWLREPSGSLGCVSS
jgi:hypothetical protein